MDTLEEIKLILKELAISQKETDAKFKETDAKFKKTDGQMAKTDAQIKELGKQIGGIGEKFGSFTEGLAYPSLCKQLLKNYHIDNTSANVKKRFPNGSEVELDAFGYTNGSINNAVVVEVKSHLKSEHIYKFTDLLTNFRTLFPEYKNKHLYGIIATVRNVPKELKAELFEAGIELAIVHDDIFDLQRNPKAKDWNLA